MPYFLARPITLETPGKWAEGPAYSRQNIYNQVRADHPPVHYDRHSLGVHSLCHADAPSHIFQDGSDLLPYFEKFAHSPFFGEAWVAKVAAQTFPHFVTGDELKNALSEIGWKRPEAPARVLLSCTPCPLDGRGLHSDSHPLVLSVEAATWLASNKNYATFGTSWKSTDYQPQSRDRPIHKILLEQGPVFELLDLAPVPVGRYFWVGFPLPLAGASESPVAPVLFTSEDLRLYLQE